MKRKRDTLLGLGVVAGLSVATWFGANAALATPHQVAPLPNACVKFGAPNSINGNYMLWNWNNSTVCPAGTYPVYFSNKTITIIKPTGTATATVTVTPPPVTSTATVTVTPTPSVTTSTATPAT